MLNIKLICVGKLKEKFYLGAAAEYTKRLSSLCRLEVEELPESRLPAQPSPAEVEAALKKAGINPNLVDSDDHISSNIAKGWLTEEEAEKARVIKKEAAEAKAANLPEQMIQNIAKGRMAKFFKENCLVNQEVIMHEPKENVSSYLKAADKELKVLDFKRFTLRAD